MALSEDSHGTSRGSPLAQRMSPGMIGTLSLGHITGDLNQGALPMMLPYFVTALGLSYTSAGGLVMALTITSSVVQPFLGQLSDRHPAPWLVPAGVFFAGAGIALSSIIPSYLLIWLAIGISGLGVAAFHPEGARLTNMASGARKATGMSFFSLGGSAGFAMGPVYITPFLLAFGLHGALFLVIPATLVALVLVWQIRRFLASRPEMRAGGTAGTRVMGRDQWGPFSRLSCAVVLRSVAFYGLNTFIPLYWVDILHKTPAEGGVALTVLLVTGAVGTLAGGWLADRYGRKIVVVIGYLASGPLMFAFAAQGDPMLQLLLLVPIGLALFAPSSVVVVLGQEYLPNRIGTASGVTLGLAVTVGGLSAPLLGYLADHQGIPAVLMAVAALPLVAGLFGLSLPEKRAESKTA